jgi:hypothetical protein
MRSFLKRLFQRLKSRPITINRSYYVDRVIDRDGKVLSETRRELTAAEQEAMLAEFKEMRADMDRFDWGDK